MSDRKKFRESLREFTGDVKEFFGRKGPSRPNTPSLPRTESVSDDRENPNPCASVSRVLPPSLTRSQGGITPDDISLSQEEVTSNATQTGLSQSVAKTSDCPQSSSVNVTGPSENAVSGTASDERIDGLIIGHIDKDQALPTEESSGPPNQTHSNAMSAKWKGLKELKKSLEPLTDLFGPIKEMVDTLVGCVDTYQVAEGAEVEYDELQVQLGQLLVDMAGHFGKGSPLTMSKSVESICASITEELRRMKAKLRRSTAVRYLEAPDDVEVVLACYRRVNSHMQRLALNANMEMWKVVVEQAADNRSDRMSSRIDRLPCALPARYNSAEGIELKRRACTPGTRVNGLATILSWARSAGEGAVYWLNGMAGTGKTTIAYSVCAELDALHLLAASFFCSRLREECRNVNNIIPAIAYQLARFSRPFRSALSGVLEKDPDIYGSLPHLQFDALIAKPILEVKHTLPEGLAVVIDALDECEHAETTSRMLDVLLSKSASLPIKFIVSSRPETQIRDRMTDDQAKSRLVLHELDKGEVRLDIDRYLREGLGEMNPSNEQIAALVERAGMLFIYAATAVRYIGYDNFQSDPHGRLGDILNGPQSPEDRGNEEIDELYTTILEAALDNRRLRKAQRDDMRQILYTVVCAREPLTARGISELLGLKDVERVRAALRPLWSVLHVVGASEVVTTLHASFPDFMFDSTRSKSYYCDSGLHHGKLAECCLEYIKQKQPQFNICGLDSSYLPDYKIPDIDKRVAKGISLETLYSCRYWADHIKDANRASVLVKQIQDFLFTQLLLWIEVLNLTHQMKAGIECVKLIAEWCKAHEVEQELAELAHDAKRFVEAFASNPVSQSTPHIHVSMLAFWPSSAPMSKHYAMYTRGPVEAEGTALDRRQLAHLSTWSFEKPIRTMAVSPDGMHLAVGIERNVLVVDSSSGRVVLGPLEGQTEAVNLIVFVPSGDRIVAVSCHNTGGADSSATVVGWDTRTGNIVLGPLQLHGHTNRINHLCFSPDCSRIAIGSYDKTIRVWVTETGKMLHQFNAQDDVYAFLYSHGGTQLAAGARKTLHRWDTRTGEPTHTPITHAEDLRMLSFSLHQSCIISTSWYSKGINVWDSGSGGQIRSMEGHTAGITCIGYSPDGRFIVSGSEDRTVCVWDAQSRNMALGPLAGHTHTIGSIMFSPDGCRIISACDGGLVCTWDAQQRSLTPDSNNTPTDRLTCAKFSSDGAHFVTGSEAGTVCIRSSHTGEIALGPVKVHANRINAVDFKHNHVVSGSEDGKICVCDALTGETVLGLLGVGSKPIMVIAYSPDGKLIAAGSNNGVQVWNAQDGSRQLGLLTSLSGPVSSAQFSPDGTCIVASSRGLSSKIVVWDVSNGRSIFDTRHSHRKSVISVSYSPNGALIASGSADRTIILWDAYTGKKALGPLTGHSSWVYSVSFSPDSARLVSGSSDRTIRIWDVKTGEVVLELLHGHDDYIRSVEYSPDGTRIMSCSNDNSVRIHDARSPEKWAQSRSESDGGDWTIDKDGWVVDDQSRLLVWVPGDLRKGLMWPRTQVVAPHGHVRLKFDRSRMGESWAQRYTSEM